MSEAETVTTPDTAEILLFAGPSGSGKTVLINQFRSGTLQADIAELLPSAARGWPQVGGNDCMKRGVPLAGILPRVWTAPGAVVHYDTAYPYRFALRGFESDPIFELFTRADRLTIVSLEPEPEVLRRQFAARLDAARGAKKASHLMWKDFVRTPFERFVGRLKGVSPVATDALYAEPGFIERCLGDWERAARRLVAAKAGRLIRVAPAGRRGESHEFRLIRDV